MHGKEHAPPRFTGNRVGAGESRGIAVREDRPSGGAVEEAIGRVDGAVSRVIGYSRQLEAIGDRQFGSQPETVGVSAPTVAVDGLVEQLHRNLEHLSGALDVLGRAIDRLEAL